MASDPLLLAMARGARQPKQPSQPDGSSILRKISGAVLSPLAMAGNVLDLPGSSVRDLLTGKDPTDQWTSKWWEDAGNRSSGRDVLTATGLTAPNDPQRWELADFGGFATELALDPLTLVSGVGGGIGKALQGTGKASHLFKVGLPFSKTALPVGKAAAGMLDNLAGKAWKTPIPFTGATAGQIGDATNVMRKGLFDYASGGDFTPKGQAFNQARTAIGEELGPEAYKVSAGLRDAMQPVEKQFLDEIASVVSPDRHDETFRRVLTHAAELGGPSGDFRNGFIKAATDITGQAPSPALVDEAEKALGAWKSSFDNLLASEREWGISTGAHQGKNVSYFPRYIDENLLKAREKAGTTGGLFSDSSTVAREEILSDVPQEALRQMLDPANRAQYMPKLSSSGSPHVFSAAKRLERDFGPYLGYTDKAGKVVTPFQHARQLAKYLGELPADATSVHALAPVGLMERRHASSARMIANAKAAHEAFQGAISPSGVKLGKAFRKIGLNDEAAIQKFAALQGITPDAAAKLRVDPETVKAIMRTQKASGSPAWLDFLGKGIDSFNRMFKTNVTMPFPAFHIRNWMSGQHMNITSPHIKGMRDVMDYMAAYNDARKIRNLGEKNTMIREAVAHKAIGGRRVFEDVELSGVSDDLGTSLLNTGQQAYQDARKIVSENPNPLMDAIPGGKAVRTGYNTVIEGGSNFAKTAEYYNRMPMFLYLKRKGLSSAEAAKEVERLQFDYSKLSPMEKGFARRIIPFYTFSRKITPQILETLIEQPGGKMAQTIRASNAGRNDEQVMPPHVADTAALPLGRKEDGSESFVTGFGLTPEAALPYITAPLDPKGALLNVGSSLTPLLKMPMEMATGQTFFQRGATGGRPLKDLDPVLGRTLSNIGEQMGLRDEGSGPVQILGDRSASRIAEHLISNSPASRLLTQIRTATDPRKGYGEIATNTLSPVKVTDVSPKAQESALIDAASAFADDIGARTWSNRYFPKDMLERAKKTDPQAYQQMVQVNALLSAAKKRAREIGKEQKKPAPRDDGERAVRQLLKLAGV